MYPQSFEPWLQHCLSFNSEEGIHAAAAVAAAMYQQRGTMLQQHALFATPYTTNACYSLNSTVDEFLSQALRWASSERVQQGMADAVQACAAMLQLYQQLEQSRAQEQQDGGNDAAQEQVPGQAPGQGAAAAAAVAAAEAAAAAYSCHVHLLQLLGLISRPKYVVTEPIISRDNGMHRLWCLLGAGGDHLTAMDAAAARVLALLLANGWFEAPAAEAIPAQAMNALARMLSDTAAAEQQQQQQQEDGDAGAATGPAASAAPVQDIVACLGAAVGNRPQLQMLLLGLAAVPPAISTMLGQPRMVRDALRLLQAVASGSAPGVQRLAVSQPAVLQGLLLLLQQVQQCEDMSLPLQAQTQQVLLLLRTLVLGNGSAQLAVARVPAMCAALVQLLSCGEDGVGSEAAETLAALQHDSSEAQALVREASRAVVMVL
jgi:hypothetical protein